MNLKNEWQALDAEMILGAMEPESQKIVTSLEIIDTVDSTSTYLLHKAKTGAASGAVCLAERQTHGRGRLGRTWVNVEGNIYCSLLWRFKQAKLLSGLSIAIAVMVVNVLHKIGVSKGLQLKWPNDILLEQRKLGGILLESPTPGCVVIGLGLNIKTPGPEVSGTGLDYLNKQINRNHLIGLLLEAFCNGLRLYQEKGFDIFRSQWDAYDFLKGKPVMLVKQPEAIYGIACGINEQGELMIQDAKNTIKAYAYGEVSVRLEPSHK